MKKNKLFTTRNMAIIALLSALAVVLMLFEFPLPFIAPGFYKLDLSEIPVLLGGFMLGPVAGVVIELLKVLLNLLINGTSTGGVGEFANFCVGCALVVPASILYAVKKNRKSALLGMLLGTLSIVVCGVLLNYFIMLPFYSKFMPMEAIIAAGAAINPAISTTWNFCVLAVGPFNLIKGLLVSAITTIIYKKVSRLLKGEQ